MEKISWQTHEFHYREKSSDWYWIVGIVAVSVAIIAIILNNIIFAILILVSAFTLSLFATKKPNFVEITLDKDAVTIGNNRHPYSMFDSFWIETRDDVPRIIFKPKKIYVPLLVIFTEDVSLEKIREVLSNSLSEEELTEPLLEKLMVYLGF